jgi:hypothetical protein
MQIGKLEPKNEGNREPDGQGTQDSQKAALRSHPGPAPTANSNHPHALSLK